jgi:hypothetical protein
MRRFCGMEIEKQFKKIVFFLDSTQIVFNVFF